MVKYQIEDKPDFYNDLEKTYENIWEQLIIGKSKSKSELHQGYISTFNNNFPSVRTVVLRHVDKKNNSISFHTDFRSSKIQEIKKNNAITMLFYDHKKKIQIIISGKAEINNQNDKSKEAWDNSRSFSKKCYLVELPPGSSSKIPISGYKKEHEINLPSPEILEKGYENFTLVEIKINYIEWLYLHRHGHRRAKFLIEDNKVINKCWLTP